MSHEHVGATTLRGLPATPLDPKKGAGDRVREFTAVGDEMSPVTPADFAGADLDGTAVPTASVNLPFTRVWWRGAAGIDAADSVAHVAVGGHPDHRAEAAAARVAAANRLRRSA
ncbi:hypothetical protein AB0I91_37030 [Actinosynnema sp. NPDC049800]